MVINGTKSEPLRARYALDIEQLDYKFIRKCEKVKTIESILKVLRSGEEGVYPDLVRFTEERLRALKPGSSLLRTEQPATTLRSLDCEVRDELLSDLKEWKHEVSTADAELKSTSNKLRCSDDQLPPVRGAMQLSTSIAKEPSPAPLEKPARIPSYDYAAWDRYDVEAQLKLVDESEADAVPEPPAEHSDPAIDDQPPVEGLSAAERDALALRERQKGNEYFRDGDFSHAAVYYTRSINASPTVAAFNNRAQTNLKLGKYGSALMDSQAVLRREPRNVKALLRRGIARQMSRDWIKARADFQQVLQVEPNNPQARQHLDEVDKAIIGSETKRSRVLIQEVDSIEEENAGMPAAAIGGCDDQPGIDGSGQAASVNVAAPVGNASDVQKKVKRPGGEGSEEPETRAPQSASDSPKQQSIFLHGVGSNDSNTEDVLISARYKDRKAQKDNISDNATCERPEEQVTGQKQHGTTSTYSQSSNAKTSPNGPEITIGVTSEAAGQGTPIGSPPSEWVDDGDARDHHLTGPQSSDRAAAATPRRWRTAEFLRQWRAARRSDGSGLTATAALLRSVAPHQLPEVLGFELDSAILSTVIRCVEEVLLAEEGPGRCCLLLERLTHTARFDAIRLLLGDEDRQRLRALTDTLQRRGAGTALLTRRFLC